MQTKEQRNEYMRNYNRIHRKEIREYKREWTRASRTKTFASKKVKIGYTGYFSSTKCLWCGVISGNHKKCTHCSILLHERNKKYTDEQGKQHTLVSKNNPDLCQDCLLSYFVDFES